MMIKTAILATAAILAATPMAAAAKTDEYVSTKVAFDDLNLETEAGQKALAKRIKLASEELCDEPIGAFAYRAMADYRACKAGVIEQAAAKLAALGIDKPATLALR